MGNVEPKLRWYQRKSDQRWNARCRCGSTLCGFAVPNLYEGKSVEDWHFETAAKERKNDPTRPECGRVEEIPEDA